MADFKPISFDEYKEMDKNNKRKYIESIALNFKENISSLSPIDGSEIFEFGKMQPPELVDLGLPSGNLWAATNIGASTPYEPGLYFAWGDINGYYIDDNHLFIIDNYILWDGSDFSKYNNDDNFSNLLPADDAATVNFGEGWHIPSDAEFHELVLETEISYSSDTNSLTFIAKNGNEISFFIGGFLQGELMSYGENGCYWSNKVDGNNAFCFNVTNKVAAHVNMNKRHCGLNIRPTYLQKN